MDVRPLIRTPFTDVFGQIECYQHHPICAPFELRMANCLDAYGFKRGLDKCEYLIRDFQECVGRGKRSYRQILLFKERAKEEYKTGKRREFLPMPPTDLF